MINPSNIEKIGDEVIWTIKVENGTVFNNNVYVGLVIPDDFTVDDSFYKKGSLDVGFTQWTIGDMNAGEILELKLVVSLNDTPSGAEFLASYQFIAQVFGLDTNTENNILTDTLLYDPALCEPLAGATASSTSIVSIDVTTNDTVCTNGTTEWRIDQGSITNATLQNLEESVNGVFKFCVTDPTVAITGTYDLYCVVGADEYSLEQNVAFTIAPIMCSKTALDHTVVLIDYINLNATDQARLEILYPDLADKADYCWIITKNGDQLITSAIPMDCSGLNYAHNGIREITVGEADALNAALFTVTDFYQYKTFKLPPGIAVEPLVINGFEDLNVVEGKEITIINNDYITHIKYNIGSVDITERVESFNTANTEFVLYPMGSVKLIYINAQWRIISAQEES